MIVHNDFRRERAIFPLFEGLTVPGLDDTLTITDDIVEQYKRLRRGSTTLPNGYGSPNGTSTPAKVPDTNGLANTTAKLDLGEQKN